MKNSKLIPVLLVCVFGPVRPAYPALETLNLASGARPAGLAEACVAVPGDVNTAQYNPALFAGVKENSLSFMYVAWIDDLNIGYAAASYVVPKLGVVGFGAKYVFYKPFPMIDAAGEETGGTLSGDNLAVSVSFGRTLSPQLDVGLGVKVLQDRYHDYTFLSGALDAGLVYTLDFSGTRVPLAVALRNAGMNFSRKSGTRELELPPGIAAGFSASRSFDVHGLLAAFELNADREGLTALRVGAEYWYDGMFGVRGGYERPVIGPAVFKVGGGIRQPIMSLLQVPSERWEHLEVGVDYTFAPYTSFGDAKGYTHAISLTIVDRRK